MPMRINKITKMNGDSRSSSAAPEQALYNEVVRGFVGRRLRAKELVQQTDGLGSTTVKPDHTLVFHIEGGPVERYQGGKLTGRNERNKTSTLVPANTEADWCIPDPTRILHLYLDDSDLRHFALQEFGYENSQLEVHDHMGVEDQFMHHFGSVVLEELKSDLPKTQLTLDGFDYVVAGHILRAYSNMSDKVVADLEREAQYSNKEMVRQVQEILLDRLSENVSAAELSEELDVSPFRLMRLFKSEVGISMRQFLMQRRIAFVKDRLAHSNDRLVDIAIDAGFSSQSHMSVCFKAAIGVPPGQYRRMING